MRSTIVNARRVGLSAVSVAVFALLASCGLPGLDTEKQQTVRPSPEASFTPKAPMPSGSPLGPDARVPKPPEADGRNPDALVEAWAAVAYSYDTKYDRHPHDAVLRALPYFTEEKARAEREYRPKASPGDRWNTWAEHRAWTTVKVTPEFDGEAPPDTPTTAHRQVSVDGKAVGRDGWEGTGPRLEAYVTLERQDSGAPWRISEITVIEAAPVPTAQPSESTSEDTR